MVTENEKPPASHEGFNQSSVARGILADHIVPGKPGWLWHLTKEAGCRTVTGPKPSRHS